MIHSIKDYWFSFKLCDFKGHNIWISIKQIALLIIFLITLYLLLKSDNYNTKIMAIVLYVGIGAYFVGKEVSKIK